MGNKRSQKTPGQHCSPVVFPVKKSKTKSAKKNDVNAVGDDSAEIKASCEHRIDIGDENSDLIGYNVFSGKLSLVNKFKNTSNDRQDGMNGSIVEAKDAKLSSKALVWSSLTLYLEDVISVSYSPGLRHFTLHTYVYRKSWLSCIVKPKKCLKDFCFLASSPPEATKWVSGFAELQCFVKCLPHPMTSSKTQSSELLPTIPLYDEPIKCKSPPRVLVILNPRSGHGRSSKVFHGKVEPIFKLAGFEMEVVKTTCAGHAKKLASTIDYSSCPDGIICIGGDGIVNEVLNGLLIRDNQKEPFSIPIGIIPAGSDNSLVWTILGVRDPVSAAMTIVKGGFTPTDVFAVEWIQNGIIHYGTTVSYYGFLSDVLELSEKYQKRFGPLRYFVAGFLKFLCLPQFSFDLEYLPASTNLSNNVKLENLENRSKTDVSDLFTQVMRKSDREGLPRASSLSTIDSIMTPSRMSGDMDTSASTLPSDEPSEFVRCLDPKSKQLSSARSNLIQEPEEVVRPQVSLSSTPNYPRTRSKSRGDKVWTGLSINTTSDSRLSWANDKEEISSTISDPGPIWDCEPKWDHEAHWGESENPIEFQGPPYDIEQGTINEFVPSLDEKWVVKKGKFLGVLVCNHSCKTVQSLSSQVVAPKAVHDDNTLDLLMVRGSGRFRLLRFFILLQFGRHLSLPYVEYVKVKSVKLKATKNNQNGCGIDGELIKNNGQVICYLLPEQCRLIGRPAKNPT